MISIDTEPVVMRAGTLNEIWWQGKQWAVQGCGEWRRDGLNPPKAVRDATSEYLVAEDSFAMWIEECTGLAADWEFEKSADLYASWKSWSDKAGEETISRKRFADLLQSRGYRTKKGTGGIRGFEGIRLQRPDYSDDARTGG